MNQLRGPLLPSGFQPASVELASVAAAEESSALASEAAVRVVRVGCKDYINGVGLVAALFCPIALITYVVIDSWQNNPSNRSWLILGLGFYIGAALKVIYEAMVRVFDRLLFLRVEIRRVTASTLFQAVSSVLETEAELSCATCSRDNEALQEHDPVTGELKIHFNFWSTRPCDLRVRVSPSSCDETPMRWLSLLVEYSPGSDIVCGRDSRLQSQATLVLSTRTTQKQVREDKKLLRLWLEQCYQKWVRPVGGVVKVYALQQMSSDWTPEWKLERVKSCKSAMSSGQSFYLERESLQRILADAKLWSGLSLRVYMVSGPPGVGKSEFIIWLASQLGLPIYRLSLSSTSLTDALLAQLLSQSSITDNSVLVQVDEFQETLRRWDTGCNDKGVTAGGFSECVQGATAMRSGVMIVCGTTELTSEPSTNQAKLTAVYRRIVCKAELTWLTTSDKRLYFRNFLRRFLPEASSADWEIWEDQFLQSSSPWLSRNISIDMLKQFLMSQITEASVHGIGTSGSAKDFRVPAESRNAFFRLICDSQCATMFLDAYASVAPAGG